MSRMTSDDVWAYRDHFYKGNQLCMYTCSCTQTCCIMMMTLLFTQLGLVMLAHLSPVVVQLTAHILILVRCSEFTELGLLLLPLKCDLLLCLGTYVLKAYSSWFVCVSVSVNPISWGALKPSTAECITGTVQQYLKLNSLRFLNKALFTVYDMIFSSRMPLGHIPDWDSPEDKYAHIRSPCNLKLGSIQQVQLLAAELCS